MKSTKLAQKKIPISSNVIFWEPGLNHEGHMSLKRAKLWVWCQQKDSNLLKCYFLRTRAKSGRSHVTEKGKTLGMMSTNLAPKKDSNFIKCYFLRTRAESWRSHVSEKGQTLGMMSTKRFQFHKMLFSENQGWIRKVTCHWKGQNFGFDDNRHGPPKKIPILSNIIFWEPALWGNFVAVCLYVCF